MARFPIRTKSTKSSDNTSDEDFAKKAYIFGKLLALRKLTLIYGGAKVGIMGALANGVLENGGKAIGVLPVFFQEKEIVHENLDELILVNSMHERKVKLIDMSDAFVALPGGFGTLDEISEVLTLSQLGKYKKPMGFLNIDGFFDHLLQFFDTMFAHEYIKNEHLQLYYASPDATKLIEWLKNYEAPVVKQWIK